MVLGDSGVSRVFFEFAVPTLGILFLIVAPLVGWQKQKMRIEESRKSRIKAHSTERGKLLARTNMGPHTITISGVVAEADTVLIGYRKPYPQNGVLTPGEKIDEHGMVSGTWLAWVKTDDRVDIDKLQFWCRSRSSVVITVDPMGTDLHFIEPLTLDEVKMQLVPT